MNKFYVTTPIYYVNAAPHIGGAYTTLAADMFARFHRARGDEVFFLTGTAEHGKKIATDAEKADLTPQAFADQNAEKFKAAWEKLGISYDDFIRTTEKRHIEAVGKFFLKLKESGKLYEDEYEGLYCVGCEMFLKESELDEDGNCPLHHTKPEQTKEKNWFFKLSDYGEFLKEKIESGELKIQPQTRKNEILSFIDHGLEDIAISRQNVSWAIPLPWDESQTIYVWLDELFNYCSAIGYGTDDDRFSKWWPADLHLVGKDIIKFHCIIWPALLEAIGEAVPKEVFAHGFFTIEGEKMSKSLGNVILPGDLVEEYGKDGARYLIILSASFGQDGDVTKDRYRELYNADLANGIGNLAARVAKLAEGIEKNPAKDTKADWNSGVVEAMEDDRPDLALLAIRDSAHELDKKLDEQKPWEKEGQERADILDPFIRELIAIGYNLEPFLPDTGKKLQEIFTAEHITKGDSLFVRV